MIMISCALLYFQIAYESCSPSRRNSRSLGCPTNTYDLYRVSTTISVHAPRVMIVSMCRHGVCTAVRIGERLCLEAVAGKSMKSQSLYALDWIRLTSSINLKVNDHVEIFIHRCF